MKNIGYRHLPATSAGEILSSVEIAGPLNVFSTLSLVYEKYKRDKDSACLSFVDEERYLNKALSNSLIKGILIRKELFQKIPHSRYPITFILTDNPYLDFFKLHIYLYYHTRFYNNPGLPSGKKIGNSNIAPTAIIEDGAVIGDDCNIMDYCIIRKGVVIGDRVLIQQGTVIGSIGFEPKTIDGKLTIAPHDGSVYIGDDVEIGANNAIDRGIYGIDTRVGNFTKTDNFVHIGHNCQIGERCRMAAGAVISGSTVIGDGVWLGPGAVVSDSIKIGNNVRILLGSVVICDVADGETLSGNFAVDHKTFMAKWFQFFRLKNNSGKK